jgi:hypothetical protein
LPFFFVNKKNIHEIQLLVASIVQHYFFLHWPCLDRGVSVSL